MTQAVAERQEEKKKPSLAKRLLIEELEREVTSSPNTFFSRYERLSVQDINELRRSLEKVSRRTMTVKHTLMKKILEKSQLAEAARFLKGSVLVTLGVQEPQAASKVLVEFAKGHENVELRGLILEGKVYDANFVKELAKLPSRKELLTQVAIGMKSPIAGLAMVLQGLIQSLAIALSEIHKKKAEQATA